MPINPIRRMMCAWAAIGLLAIASPVIARDLATIKASGTLVVAVPDIRNPPFFFEDGGELKGLDIDLAKALAESMGVKAVFNRDGKSFNDAVNEVVRGRADIAAAKISRTLARAQTVLFTDPYLVLPHALLVNRLKFAEISRGKPATDVLKNYPGSIGVIANSSFVGFARTYFPKASIVEFENWDAVVDAVATGKVTAAYRDAFETKRIFKVRPDLVLNVRSVLIEDITDTIGIAVGADNFHLHSYLNLYLSQKNIRYTSDQILSDYEKFLH